MPVSDSPKLCVPSLQHKTHEAQSTEDKVAIQNGNITKDGKDVQCAKHSTSESNHGSTKEISSRERISSETHRVPSTTKQDSTESSRNVPTSEHHNTKRFESPTTTAERRKSRTPDPQHHPDKRRASMKSDSIDQQDASVCGRRVSVPTNRTTPKKKIEGGQHVVAKSELWDTGSQHRCPKSHPKSNRISISQDEGTQAKEKE